ncbi:MAG: fused MFS/spermidine synthase [Gemmatimonadetes bacterium]|nr:fused MFS/spermidine synthase [Gemmatimonadota bacterium]
MTTAPWPAVRVRATLTLFAGLTFTNAALLFVVQPMFTKMVLPLLGGTAAVWNTCLLFFQAALLLGYCYAHMGSRLLDPTRQGLLHLVLLALALLVLPISIPEWLPPPSDARPVWWLLAVLAASLGLPFTLLAAGAPMFQRWFASTAHPGAGNPYVLYVASNLGSFAALLAYPLLVEPRWRLGEQGTAWRTGYLVLVALVGAAWWITRRWSAVATPSVAPVVAPAPTRALRVRWVLLSAVPSSLLLGVTTFISTDVAAVPLLWVVPLSLYLLTFTLVFGERPLLGREFMSGFHLFVGIALLVVVGMTPTKLHAAHVILHLLGFFGAAMVCHRQLADVRPHPAHLTEYYLWMSLGGVIGGAFNVLVAPVLYQRVIEYPLMLLVAFALRPGYGVYDRSRRAWLLDLVLPALVFGGMVASFQLRVPVEGRWPMILMWSVFTVAGLAVAAMFRRPLRLALGAAALFLAIEQRNAGNVERVITQERSFFGVYKVTRWEHYLMLTSGTTTHGAQDLVTSGKRTPLTYYTRQGPLGDIFSELTDSTQARRVGLVGLGTGTTACYARPGEPWTYFEIDPTVVQLATSGRVFTYVKECAPGVRIVLGDARRSLAAEPDRAYDLLVFDAFSSDAIPVHLMTREAVQLYRTKLQPYAAMAFHVSNRYLHLEPVLAAIAMDEGLVAVARDDAPDEEARAALHYGSRWVVLAPDSGTVRSLINDRGWRPAEPRSGVSAWTDDYSNIVRLLKKE